MPSSAVAPQNGQEPVEGFAASAAADARTGPVLHVAARRGGAGQFHRQARPPLGLDSCHDRADAAHVAGYRADLRSDSWWVRRFAQQDVLWHVLSLASWFATLLGSMP